MEFARALRLKADILTDKLGVPRYPVATLPASMHRWRNVPVLILSPRGSMPASLPERQILLCCTVALGRVHHNVPYLQNEIIQAV